MEQNNYVLWSNMNLDLKEWENSLREHYNIDNLSYDDFDENDHYITMCDINSMYLDGTRSNLNKQLNGTISLY